MTLQVRTDRHQRTILMLSTAPLAMLVSGVFFYASAGQIFFRSNKHLYCVSLDE